MLERKEKDKITKKNQQMMEPGIRKVLAAHYGTNDIEA